MRYVGVLVVYFCRIESLCLRCGARGLLKALGRMVCRVLLGGFGVNVCSGCKGLLMVSGEDELLLNELNELDRSTGWNGVE